MSKGSRKKRTAFGKSPPSTKTAHGLGKAASIFAEKPTWRTNGVDLGGPFGWEDASAQTVLCEVVPKLHIFESMTFRELDDAGNHDIEVTDLCSKARRRLQSIGREDIGSLYSMHLAGVRRVWAHRDFTRLNILWWDPEHAVYPVKKKHT